MQMQHIQRSIWDTSGYFACEQQCIPNIIFAFVSFDKNKVSFDQSWFSWGLDNILDIIFIKPAVHQPPTLYSYITASVL